MQHRQWKICSSISRFRGTSSLINPIYRQITRHYSSPSQLPSPGRCRIRAIVASSVGKQARVGSIPKRMVVPCDERTGWQAPLFPPAQWRVLKSDSFPIPRGSDSRSCPPLRMHKLDAHRDTRAWPQRHAKAWIVGGVRHTHQGGDPCITHDPPPTGAVSPIPISREEAHAKHLPRSPCPRRLLSLRGVRITHGTPRQEV